LVLDALQTVVESQTVAGDIVVIIELVKGVAGFQDGVTVAVADVGDIAIFWARVR